MSGGYYSYYFAGSQWVLLGYPAQAKWRPQGDSNPRYRRERAQGSVRESVASGNSYYRRYYLKRIANAAQDSRLSLTRARSQPILASRRLGAFSGFPASVVVFTGAA